jgi:predicted HAD superfamily Cof-like phosphohydrolase
MVEEFHQAFGVPVINAPAIPNSDRLYLRESVMEEEFKELLNAMYNHDMVGILDGLCDLLYTVYGTAHEYGLGPVLKEAFREVHRSNMSKLGADGKPVMREDGKVLKGPNFTPPDLAGVIHRAFPFLPSNDWRQACDKAGEIPPLLATVQANIEFKQTIAPIFPDKYERQVLNEQPPADGNY